jgi:DNA-binding transcriptional LysR family regulator
MELRQLEHFVAVAEERHFTRAARRAHIVQSGLSTSIRALERDLGSPLLVRSTRRVELTAAGAAFLAEARRVLAAAAAAREAVSAVQGLLRGTLTVGIMQAHAALDLPAVLGRFHARHPGVELRLRQAASTLLVEEVRAGTLDLAVTALPGPAPAGLVRLPLGSEPMQLACAPGHRLAGRASVRLVDLRDEPFVDFVPGWGVRIAVDRAFADAGIARPVALEVNDTATLLDLVAHGLGVAVVPPTVAARAGGVRLVPLRGRTPVWEEAVVHAAPEPVAAAARALLAMVGGAGA